MGFSFMNNGTLDGRTNWKIKTSEKQKKRLFFKNEKNIESFQNGHERFRLFFIEPKDLKKKYLFY